MQRTNRVRIAAALGALCLVAVACGGSDRNDSSATTASKSSAAATTAAPATSAAAPGTTAAAAPGTTAAPTTTAAAGEKFGDLASPCGKGDATGATANGVTDTEITIGTGDDRGYSASPGLNKEIGDAMVAIVDWCNKQGGINGRQIKLNNYDAKILEVKAAMTQACSDKVFMLVGQGWSLDAGQEDVRIGCKLATVPTYSVSAAFAMGPGMLQPLPNPGDQFGAERLFSLAKLYPDAVKKTAFVYGNYSATQETADKTKAAMPAAGWVDLNCDQVYNIIGESDWKPFAENLKKCGAEMVVWVGSPAPNFENLLAAVKQVGFAPKAWLTDVNHYDAAFAKWNADNGGLADTVHVMMSYPPFEEASSSPAVQQYLDIVKASGGKQAQLGMQATSAFLLWATGAQQCGSTLTPKCVLDKIKAIKGWTAGGLHVPSDPGDNNVPNCAMMLKLNGGAWERVDPASGYDCNDKYRVTGLKTKALEAAKVGADRIATQFGTFTPEG